MPLVSSWGNSLPTPFPLSSYLNTPHPTQPTSLYHPQQQKAMMAINNKSQTSAIIYVTVNQIAFIA